MDCVSIVSVKDVEATSGLLQKVFGWKSNHGGPHFEDLVNQEGQSVLWLHDLDGHEHARFKGMDKTKLGMGISIYVFVDDAKKVHKKAKDEGLSIIEEPIVNPNTNCLEFSFRLAEGYTFTATNKGPGFTS